MKKIKNKGITLIALVITIIILLILAGITINQLTESGLFEKAVQASEEAKYGNAAEKVALAVNASYDKKGELNSTQLKENLNKIEGINPKVQEIEYDLKVVVDGYEFTITKIGQIIGIGKTNQLPENSANTKAGTEVALEEGWGTQTVKYIKTTDGTEVKTLETVATVYAVSDGKNNTIPVPNGFYYVGGTKETGVVISDDARDKNKFINFVNTTEVVKGIPSGAVYNADGTIKTENLTEEEKKEVIYGNQFVWIPSTISEYKKEDFGYKNNDTTCWDKTTPTAEKTQIQKYNGFYVGRYEAGTSNAKFNTTVGQAITANQKTIQGVVNSGQSEVYTKANTKAGSKPTSKAGEIPWFHADYETSYEMSEKMYNTDYVQSGLMTGTMWDTMINWMSGEANKADIKGNCKWGNYYDIGLANVKGRCCSMTSTSGTNAWSTSAWTKSTGTTANIHAILTTGSTEEVKKKNLYDIAGNLWEWVDESTYCGSYHDIYSLRGSSFDDAYATSPVCFRNRGFSTHTYTNNGFRVALYIK